MGYLWLTVTAVPKVKFDTSAAGQEGLTIHVRHGFSSQLVSTQVGVVRGVAKVAC